jgi:hypothetical protein
MKKNYQVHFYVLKQVEEKIGKLLNYHAKKVIEEVVNLSWDEVIKEVANLIQDDIHKELMDIVDESYKEAVRNRQVGIYVDEETHRKWKSIPRGIKKQAQFLINIKLYLIATNKEEKAKQVKQSKPLSIFGKIFRI